MSRSMRLTLTGAFLLLCAGTPIGAHDHNDPDAQWYRQQQINPEALPRLNVPFKSCCDAGDHYKTRARLLEDGTKYGVETYEYWHYEKAKWLIVPPDIIKKAKTPDGRPVLFIQKVTGKELCFIIDEEGI